MLLVEDNPITRKMMRVALETEGMRGVEAGTGAQALERLAADRPDVVLQDLHLPDVGGTELLTRLRLHPAGQHVPVIGMSGLASKLEEAEHAPQHFVELLLKPVHPSELIDAVRRHLPTTQPPVPERAVAPVCNSVLVALTDPTLRLGLTELVRSTGTEALSAADGLSALELARARPPGCVVADCDLPELDGFSLAAALRKLPDAPAPAIVLVTRDHISQETEMLAQAAQADALVRDGDEQALYDRIRELSALHAAGLTPKRAGTAPSALAQHLERQAATIARLDLQRDVLSAEVSILSGVPEAMTRATSPEEMLERSLRRCLDLPEVTAAAVYLGDRGGPHELRSQVGFDHARDVRASRFFGHPELLEESLRANARALVRGSEYDTLLCDAGLRSMVLVPICSAERRLGTLVLGARDSNVARPGFLGFATTLAAQIGAAIFSSDLVAQLRQSERRQRLMVDAIEDYAIFMLDKQGRVQSWNRGAERTTGYSASEMQGTDYSVLFTERERQAGFPRRRLQRALERGTLIQEGWRVRKDGTWFPVLGVLTPVHEESGGLVGFVSVVRDNTQQNHLRQALGLLVSSIDVNETLENISRVVVPLLGDISVIVWREDGKPKPCIHIHAHESAANLGRRFEEVRDEFQRLLTREQPQLVEELKEDMAEPFRQVLFSVGLRSFVSVPLIARTGIKGAIAVGTGDCGRRTGSVELALLQGIASPAGLALENADLYRQAQRAIRDREDVLAIVSHDLKNPLNAVGLWADAVKRIAARKEDPKLEEIAARIRRGTMQMQALIAQLLEFSRLEAGGAQLERHAVDVRGVVGSALEPLRPLADQRGHTLRYSQPAEAIDALVDEQRINQVVSNLVGNAIKHTPEGTHIAVELARDEDSVRLIISDDGPGIPAEQAEHIFDRYWQPPGSTKKGTGLGLFIVRNLVEAHGGVIRVESELGNGTRFVVELPLETREAPPAWSAPRGEGAPPQPV